MITLAQVFEPVCARCAKCGGEMTIYPVPMPKGTAVCAVCSPPWLGVWLAEWTRNELRQREREREEIVR